MKRKPKTIAFWMGRLPHWEVEGGRYFITVHLAGAIPQAGKDEIRSTSKRLRDVADRDSPQWIQLQRRIFLQMESWLDRANTNNWLRNRAVAEMAMEAITHRHLRHDWHVFEYVIMPTHIHLFCEFGERGMKTVFEDFKRWTGHRGMAMLDAKRERFWQREWFDHWSRSDLEDDRIIAYIRTNPEKAGLVGRYSDWPYASWNDRTMLDYKSNK